MKPLVTKFFSADIKSPIQISIDQFALACAIQATLDAFARKMAFNIFLIRIRHLIKIKRTCLRSVTFLTHNNMNTIIFSHILYRIDQLGMRNITELLIVGSL